jgi:hypothetical protein
MENPNEILCYDRCRMSFQDGVFNENDKKIKLAAIPMRREDAAIENEKTYQKGNGIIFILNTAATAAYKDFEKKRKEQQEAAHVKKTVDAKALINSVFDTLLRERIAEGRTNEPTLAEMKSECSEKGYPKSEWQALRKAELIEYLKSKTE